MAKINKHIEVTRSPNQKNYDLLADSLRSRYTHVGITDVDNIDDLKLLVSKQPDLVFLRTKRLPGTIDHPNDSSDTIWISEYLDECGINYTGSAATAVALDYDKTRAKQIVGNAGLNTPAFFIAKEDEQMNIQDLSFNFPLFVKPLNCGDGVGIGADSVVRDFDSLKQKVLSIIKDFHGAALVEEYLPGREFSVALLKNLTSDNFLVMPIEIITDKNDKGDRILGRKTKREDTERVFAVPEGDLRESVIDFARKIFEVLGARDYGRIDIRMDKQGVPSFIEANLVPGIGRGYLARAYKINTGRSYDEMVLHIVDLAFSRSN